MQYIIDFIDTASEQEVSTWLQDNHCKVSKTFSHFTMTYLVETDTTPAVGGIVTYIHQDDASTAIKLLSSTYTAPVPYHSFALDSTDEKQWWKIVSFNGALNAENPSIARIGHGYPVYVMDSGVDSTHPEFADATIRNLYSFTGEFTDTKGHGTAIASLISGKTCGITDAEIVSVKIFQDNKDTLVSDILSALDAIAKDYIQNYNSIPAVINMSWTIDRNSYVDSKIESLLNLGLLVSASAGNSGIPIENVTPAAIANVLTVGSINTNLEPSSFSDYTGPLSTTQNSVNYSPGLDLWAPGEHIYAALVGGTYGLTAGTSMAAAVVSALCLYNIAADNLTYGTTITNRIFMDFQNPRSVPVISIQRGSLKDTVISSGKYVDPIRNSILFKNGIFPTQSFVHLTEKYSNCTDLVLTAKGLTRSLADIQNSINAGSTDHNALLYIPNIVVAKGVTQSISFLRSFKFDSFTLGDLPSGLSLSGTQITGIMSQDLGNDKSKNYIVPLTLTRGTDTISTSVTIFYYDPGVFSQEYTLAEFRKDTNLALMGTLCPQCGGYYTECPYLCAVFSLCPDGKTSDGVCFY